MVKKTVRVDERTLSLAKSNLGIADSTQVSVDEIITLLLMETQRSSELAQNVLDQLGDTFTQKVNGQSNPRLTLEKGHFYENGHALKIDLLLERLSEKPTTDSIDKVYQELVAFRHENKMEHKRQSNVFSAMFLSIRLMVAEILRRLSPSESSENIIASTKVSSTSKSIRKGIDAFAVSEVKKAALTNDKKRKGRYDD